MPQGCLLARKLEDFIGAPVASATTLTAIAVGDQRRVDGCITVTLDTGTPWVFLLSSTAVAGPTVKVPDAGSGRWHAVGSGALGGAGKPAVASVRYASTGALAAYTRTGNVLLADANGALGAIDDITGVVGERFLLKDGASHIDDGIYRLDAVGTAGTKWQMTRVGDADASAEVVAGMLVYISEGTANGNEWYFLSTNDAITLNTTALTFTQLPPLSDMQSADTSLTTRVSTEESTRGSADTSLTTRVSTEESTRGSADTSLTTRVSTAESTETATTTSLDTRVSTAESLETSTTGSLTTRVSTAESVETSTTASLTTRVSTAESVETSTTASLTTRVSTSESTVTSADLSLTTRVSTAESVETSSTGSIDTRVSTVELLALKLLATATITSDDLTAAGVGPETENVGAVTSDNAVPMAVRIKLVDAFDNGAGVSLSMTVGWNGAVNRFITAADCFTGSALEGVGWVSGTRNAEPQLGFPSGSTQFTATFTAGADTLANFTNGSVVIEVWGLDKA